MKLTEKEARTKECPLKQGKPMVSKCIASDCMGWRWCYDTTYSEQRGPAPPKPMKSKTNKGYCGLAYNE